MTAIYREHLDIGRAIYRAAKSLPEGWMLHIEIEKDSGSVRVFNPDGNEILIDCGGLFSEQINAGIDFAVGAES